MCICLSVEYDVYVETYVDPQPPQNKFFFQIRII